MYTKTVARYGDGTIWKNVPNHPPIWNFYGWMIGTETPPNGAFGINPELESAIPDGREVNFVIQADAAKGTLRGFAKLHDKEADAIYRPEDMEKLTCYRYEFDPSSSTGAITARLLIPR